MVPRAANAAAMTSRPCLASVTSSSAVQSWSPACWRRSSSAPSRVTGQRGTGPGERLGHQIPGQLAVAHADHYDPQAVVLGRGVEVGESLSVVLHAPYTSGHRDRST